MYNTYVFFFHFSFKKSFFLLALFLCVLIDLTHQNLPFKVQYTKSICYPLSILWKIYIFAYIPKISQLKKKDIDYLNLSCLVHNEQILDCACVIEDSQWKGTGSI